MVFLTSKHSSYHGKLVRRGGYFLANIGENVASGLPKIGKIAYPANASFVSVSRSLRVQFLRRARWKMFPSKNQATF